jgi:hypothetical protein
MSRRDRLSIALAALFFIIVLFSGGSSRADEPAQIAVRVSSVIFGAVAAVRLSKDEMKRVRTPFVFLCMIVVIVGIGLVPLPPALWNRLPGRADFGPGDALAGVAQVWRPLSLTPDNTLNALVALFPPLAALLLLAAVPRRFNRQMMILLVAGIFTSAMFAAAQLLVGLPGLYGFRVDGFDGAVGLFSNRNHQALFLALAMPILATLVRAYSLRHVATLFAGLGFILAWVLILVTGSRAGLLLGAIGTISAFYLHGNISKSLVQLVKPARANRRAKSKALPIIVALAGVALIGITAISARSEAVQRLFQDDPAQEIRVKLAIPMLEMGMTYFPFGAGFGSFVDVFKYHERLSDLSEIYLNHAHNEVIEIFIEGGVPAIALVLAALIWIFRASTLVWRRASVTNPAVPVGRLGSVMMLMILIASLADYPLRTPILMVVFALSATWLAWAAEMLASSRRATDASWRDGPA